MERHIIMSRKYFLIITCFLILSVGLSIVQPLEASFMPIPGETDEEIAVVQDILSSNDEYNIVTYLNADIDGNTPAVRKAACMRLAIIGTEYCLTYLRDAAINDTELDVRNEASYSYWVRYSKHPPAGWDAEYILLSALQTPDVTKTARVRAWAVEALGNMASQRAVVFLDAILSDPDIGSSTDYLKELAQEALAKINFINSFDPLEDPMAVIAAALVNNELCIRRWGIDSLIKQGPADILERLQDLLITAHNNGDDELASYIIKAIDKIKEEQAYPALEFVYPQDGDIVGEQPLILTWCSYSETFTELIDPVYGENTISKTVIDREGNEVTKSVTFIYQNTLPVFDPISYNPPVAGQPFAFTVHASDSEDDAYTSIQLCYLADGLPEGAEFNSDTQTFYWDSAQAGAYSITFAAIDSGGLFAEEDATIVVSEDANRAPVLEPIGDKLVRTGRRLRFRLSASDPDGDTLTYSVDNLPPRARFNANRAIFTWNTRAYQMGTYDVTFNVSDGKSVTSETISIEVHKPFPKIRRIRYNARNRRLYIYGRYFRVRNPQSFVKVESRGQTRNLPIIRWRNNLIVCSTSGLNSGQCRVRVVNKYGRSNTKGFRAR